MNKSFKQLELTQQRTLMSKVESAHCLDHSLFLLKIKYNSLPDTNPLKSVFPVMFKVLEAMRDESVQEGIDIFNNLEEQKKS